MFNRNFIIFSNFIGRCLVQLALKYVCVYACCCVLVRQISRPMFVHSIKQNRETLGQKCHPVHLLFALCCLMCLYLRGLFGFCLCVCVDLRYIFFVSNSYLLLLVLLIEFSRLATLCIFCEFEHFIAFYGQTSFFSVPMKSIALKMAQAVT